MKTLGYTVTLVLIGLSLLVDSTGAQTITYLHSFAGGSGDGSSPQGALVQDSDGNFYGTTRFHGTYAGGTIFRISPSGMYTNLYSFGASPNDGEQPYCSLVLGTDNNFYGTTILGGANTNCLGGCGTLFRISPAGTYTNLYSFATPPNDGDHPFAGLVQGADGNFYGTTDAGGAHNSGAVFRISPTGDETNLYSFGDLPNDGGYPYDQLVVGSDGNFYGTTSAGGTSTGGTIFRITPSGTYTSLYSFGGPPYPGGHPQAGLLLDSDGCFYGTTFDGGRWGRGTVFRVSPSGIETNLYSLIAGLHGGYPRARLVQGSDGNLYGVNFYGGGSTNCSLGCGTLFRITPGGSYTDLYSFGSSSNDGQLPSGGLVQGIDGSFYGTTTGGGNYNQGTVFRLVVPLNPPPYPINQISGVQMSDTTVVFNVVSVAGETYQLQFSSSLTPTNWVNVGGVSVTNSIGGLLTLTNFGGALLPQGFYRFDITP